MVNERKGETQISWKHKRSTLNVNDKDGYNIELRGVDCTQTPFYTEGTTCELISFYNPNQ